MAYSGTDSPDTAIMINPGSQLTATPFSAMGWVRMLVVNSGTPMGVWSAVGEAQRAWRFRINGDPAPRYHISFTGADDMSIDDNGPDLVVGVWNHLGMDFDGTTLRAYRNGVQGNSAPHSGTVFASSNLMGIGAYEDVAPNTASELDGDIEDVRYYNRLLTAEEWATIHRVRGLDGIVHGLVTRWPINERPESTTMVTADPKDVGPAQLTVNQVVGVPFYVPGELRQRKAA